MYIIQFMAQTCLCEYMHSTYVAVLARAASPLLLLLLLYSNPFIDVLTSRNVQHCSWRCDDDDG